MLRNLKIPMLFALHTAVPSQKHREAAFINENTDAVGFVGASSIERFACEESIPRITACLRNDIPIFTAISSIKTEVST